MNRIWKIHPLNSECQTAQPGEPMWFVSGKDIYEAIKCFEGVGWGVQVGRRDYCHKLVEITQEDLAKHILLGGEVQDARTYKRDTG